MNLLQVINNDNLIFRILTYYNNSPFRSEKLKYSIVFIICLSLVFSVLIILLAAVLINSKLKRHNKKENDVCEKRAENISLELLQNIPIKQIPSYYTNLKKNPSRLKTEYSELICEPGGTTYATLAINKKKNRYIDVLPCK